jgi:hypothetical protein
MKNYQRKRGRPPMTRDARTIAQLKKIMRGLLEYHLGRRRTWIKR